MILPDYATVNKYAINLTGTAKFKGYSKNKHFMFAAYRLYSILKDDSHIFLSNPTYMWGDRIQGIAERHRVLFSKNAVTTVNKVFGEFIAPDSRDTSDLMYGKGEALKQLYTTIQNLAANKNIDILDTESMYQLIPGDFKRGGEGLKSW